MPLMVGLTGGVGCGKTSAAVIFTALGIDIIDTDQVAHELTGPAGKAIGMIRDRFGDDFISEDGSLDRVAMRALVFSDQHSRQKLESILHPLILQEVKRRIPLIRSEYGILVVPLLLETGSYLELIDRILVIDCPESMQVARTIARSKLSEASVHAIMAAQCSRSERLAKADDVIVNELERQYLQQQVQALHEKYLSIARCGS
ncbi:dephospho-CoA kinase [Nitrosomonas halophila]|uniref:Dephospho-CoA kinase n=1 Tax=Nitrosomonas halophila TaxID=44576 RepID=A0A1H3KD08_9PROT|nr:dephospho-CoA kinase [Nitrosomonas halophila]SDY49819.1 dephospho-CoA kinase [Nitrosomonas halophila]